MEGLVRGRGLVRGWGLVLMGSWKDTIQRWWCLWPRGMCVSEVCAYKINYYGLYACTIMYLCMCELVCAYAHICVCVCVCVRV